MEEFCKTDFDCLGLDYAICNYEVNQCQCVPNFGILRKIGGCVALIGGYYEVQADCTVPDTICVDKKCQCKSKFIKKSFEECKESIIGQKCERDLDCEGVFHIGCSVGKKCVCRDNHVLIDNSTCVPLLNEFCWSDEQCAAAHSVCFENICRCQSNHITVSNVHCIKRKQGRVCSNHDDCSDMPHTACSLFRRCV
ncbi:uncharacterized protein LOC141538342 [Cotesia typhae]|uniref:uncharacterized protein LOC141538342 n=1 Tax=Cotesia typhae TaxID=2053667 RepID=UPI003D684C53